MNQLCKVCAEPAAGFHFGAFTCEGCKSFFGRTYNNLSQIHDCKNGGQCVINKQNRTSCKACRLRKCLVVGMSKTGSRYGRRSNWFKIHCLLQEQCAYSTASQPPSFRSPVTPTLQDGSLPFVNCQLRDALHTMEGPPLGTGGDQSGSPSVRIPISSPSGGGATLPSCSVGGGGGPAGGDHSITASFALGQMGAQADRRLLEETLNALRRGAGLPGSELEAMRRSHSLQPPRPFEGPALQAMRSAVATSDQIRRMGAEFERVRRASVEHETSRLSAGLSYEWERSHHHESSPVFSEAADTATKSPTPHLPKVSISVSNAREIECPTSCSELKLDCSRNDLEVICKTSKEDQSHTKAMPNRSPSRMTPKIQPETTRIQDEVETPMTEEERLSFLKTASKISTNNSVSRDSGPLSTFQGIPNLISHRPSSRDDMLYSPINNNIFPFPSYPPVWHPLLPFSALAKFYPPFNTAPLPGSPLPFEGFPNPVFSPPELRASILSSPISEARKEDSSSKKRILDAILQVQRESTCGPRSPPGGLSPPRVSVALSLSQHVTSASSVVLPLVTSTATSTAHGDQPIDLTVRRKRKMAKSEILYQPGGGGDREEEDMESEYERDLMREEEDREAREDKQHQQSPDDVLTEERMTKEILLKGTSEIVDLKANLECATSLAETKFEVPMKIMKLETSGDPLIA